MKKGVAPLAGFDFKVLGETVLGLGGDGGHEGQDCGLRDGVEGGLDVDFYKVEGFGSVVLGEEAGFEGFGAGVEVGD